MDFNLKTKLKVKGKVISFYCPEPLLKKLETLEKLLGKNKRSGVITYCLERMIDSVLTQARELHMKPQTRPEDKQWLRDKIAQKKRQKASVAAGALKAIN